MLHTRASIIAIAALAASAAHAASVQVEILGEVEFNGINNGEFASVDPGAPMSISFLLDSADFDDSVNFPVRGYTIQPGSFTFSMGGVTAALADPYPAGETPYFVLRDNDPAVDGFFLGTSIDGFPNGVATDSPAAFNDTFSAIFSVSYDNDPLPSLDILDAVGTYDFTGLTVFNLGLEDGPFQPVGGLFESLTITVIPAPGVALLAAAPVMIARRRRQ